MHYPSPNALPLPGPTVIEFDPETLMVRRDGELVDSMDARVRENSPGENVFRRMAFLAASLGAVGIQDEALPMTEHVGEAGLQMLRDHGMRTYAHQRPELERVREIIGEDALEPTGKRVGGRKAFVLKKDVVVFVGRHGELFD